jgi:hypothetical protein
MNMADRDPTRPSSLERKVIYRLLVVHSNKMNKRFQWMFVYHKRIAYLSVIKVEDYL